MRVLTKVFLRIEKISFNISMITLCLMMLWIVIDVILRTVINKPIPGTIEMTGEYLMVLLVYLSISYTNKLNGHIRVTLIMEKVNEKIKSIVKVFTNIIGAFFFISISWLNFLAGLEYYERGIKSTGVLSYSLAPALFIISLGLLLITIRLLIESFFIIRPHKEEMHM